MSNYNSTQYNQDGMNKRRIFDVPLSSQRYEWVKQYLINNSHIKSLTDFGCGNGRILYWLKNCPDIEQINFVDNDVSLLEQQLNYNFQLNFVESMNGRESSLKDLSIKVYHANVSIPDDRLRADCITMVEVIEHMHLDEVDRATRAIFGYYSPETVIITTPNSEFNQLLQDGPRATTFRHDDHKFEWTREEFSHWAGQVCSSYPYSCRFDGVGHLPNSEPYGPCTQIAIFTQHPMKDNNNTNNLQQPLQLTAATYDTNRDLQCVDLLLDKLNVKENVPDWRFDASQKKVSLMTDYVIPGSRHSNSIMISSKPFDWGSTNMDTN